jgi:hypothetical protein
MNDNFLITLVAIICSTIIWSVFYGLLAGGVVAATTGCDVPHLPMVVGLGALLTAWVGARGFPNRSVIVASLVPGVLILTASL